MSVIPAEVLHRVKAVICRIEVAAAFDGDKPDVFKEITSLKSLTKAVGMSERSLRDWFKIYTGESISRYAGRRRTEYAARVLRLFPDTSKSEVSRLIGLSTTQALYPFMKKQGVGEIDRLRGSFKDSICNILNYRVERLGECIMFYTLCNVRYEECSAAEFEAENWDKIDRYVSEKYPEAIKAGDVGFAIDKYIENKLEEGVFISGVIYNNINPAHLHDGLIGEVSWRLLSGGKYAVFTHKGEYKYLSDFYLSALHTLSRRQDLHIVKSLLIMEKYINSPTDTSAGELLTEIWIPITSY